MDYKEQRSDKIKPLLRWAGSKRKLLNELSGIVPTRFETYIEPFVGSACLYFHLQPKKAILNDINNELIGFYKAVRSHPKAVLRSALHFPRTEAGYYKARSQYATENDPIRKASLFYFLNHYCFNGIFRTNKEGHFNVPFGTRTGCFPSFSEFEHAAHLLKTASVICDDFTNALKAASRKDFVYLDPPYVYKMRKDRGEYGPSSFSLADIPRLKESISLLDKKGVRFLLSYLDCEEISDVSKFYRSKTLPVARTVSGLSKSRQIVNELMIFNY